ncbi:MAG: glycoside hydrolase family 20 zincin-like fold domain-containing protein, partial [Bacteroidales bacterium]
MKKAKTIVSLLTALGLSCGTLCAQNAEFDLSAQRSESQDVNQVPGSKIDHKGLIINPQPHAVNLMPGKTLNVAGGFTLKDKQKAFGNDFSFLSLTQKGTPVTINFGAKIAAKKGLKLTSGAYSLVISDKGIEITGFDDKGAFYGIQTLRQIIESPVSRQGELPQL